MKRIVPVVLFCSASLMSFAQDDRIDADRPSETQSPQTVSLHRFQTELGLRRERTDTATVMLHHPNILLRYGLFSGLELRAELHPQTEYFEPHDEHTTGLAPVVLGAKIGLWKGKGLIPEGALLTDVGIPKFASEKFRPLYAQPRARLLLKNEITKALSIGWNLGVDWDGESTVPRRTYTICPEWNLGKSWELFAELYGYWIRNEEPGHIFNAGVSYYTGKWSKIDLSAGVGLTSAAPVNFVAFGYSHRFGR